MYLPPSLRPLIIKTFPLLRTLIQAKRVIVRFNLIQLQADEV